MLISAGHSSLILACSLWRCTEAFFFFFFAMLNSFSLVGSLTVYVVGPMCLLALYGVRHLRVSPFVFVECFCVAELALLTERTQDH